MQETINRLEGVANTLRRNVVEMIGPNKVGHFGGSCSLAEIASVLYFHTMRHDPKNPAWPDRDRFLLSKGHAAPIQYAALAEAGYFDRAWLKNLKKLGSPLQGHPDMRKVPGVEANTGSLGQGISIACGMAAGLRLDGRKSRVFAILGDGELAEGQVWEAFMAASRHKLSNLRAIIDHNGLQATGTTAERFPIEDLADRLRAFGFAVLSINGHDVAALLDAFNMADQITDKPTAILAKTVKGKGIPCAENVVAFHNGSMTEAQYEEALLAIEKAGEAK